MKKYFLIVLTLFTLLSLASACTEYDIPGPEPEPTPIPAPEPEPTPTPDPTPEPTPEPEPTPVPVPVGQVPAHLVGPWIQGTFSLTDFWEYDGTYVGKASEQSNVFVFGPNGECEQYFIMTQRMYNCKTEAYTYKKGTVVFDEANGSFTFTPASGKYRGFYSCAPSSNIDRDSRPEELPAQTYYYQMEELNGKTYMVVRFSPTDANGSYFQKTVW